MTKKKLPPSRYIILKECKKYHLGAIQMGEGGEFFRLGGETLMEEAGIKPVYCQGLDITLVCHVLCLILHSKLLMKYMSAPLLAIDPTCI